MSKDKQIKDMCAIMSNEGYANCDGTPLVPDSSGICDYVDCRSCKQARLLMNAGYRKSEWISVDERLPICRELVLVSSMNKITRKHEWFYLARYNRERNWWDGALFGQVTHWMPLPEPPMMKGGADG